MRTIMDRIERAIRDMMSDRSIPTASSAQAMVDTMRMHAAAR